MSPDTPQDNRRSKRIDRKFVLRVTPADGNPRPVWSLVTTQDFSVGGTVFLYDRPVREGDILSCKLQFADKQMQCKAHVIRFTGRNTMWQVAVAFDWESEKDRQAIEELAKNYLEKHDR